METLIASKTASIAADLGSARILLAYGDEGESRLIESIFRQRGYDVVAIDSADGVARALEEHAIDIVVVDVDVDGEGLAAIAAIRSERRYGDVPVVLIGQAVPFGEALPTGIDDVTPKPVDPHQLLDRVRAAMRTRRSLLGMETAHLVVASLANELLSPATDVRLHTERLGTYAAQLGRRVGLSASDLNAVAYGTLLHDMAKLGIAEWILLKPGPYTEEERLAMQRHTEIGERIAAPLVGADRFGPILRHHHERWDGGGYPDGLVGEEIPMGARIIGVVDAFDAMTQYRTYRQSLSVRDAVTELKRERGAQFDPDLVDAFVDILRWDGLI